MNAPLSLQSHVQLKDSRARRIYLAGPMTGLPDFNFPAFNAEAARLRGQGLHVENPAEHGHVDGAEWGDYLRYDIGRLATCESIHLLPGWESSRGVQLEMHIANALGMDICFAAGATPLDDQPYSDPRNGDETFSANGEDWHNYDLPDLLNDRPDLKAGDTVFRAIKHYQDPASFVDHEALISSMNENAGCSDTGEWVDSWPEPGEEAETELTDLLEAWARRHCAPDFHLVRDVTEYTLTAEDLRSHAEGSDHE